MGTVKVEGEEGGGVTAGGGEPNVIAETALSHLVCVYDKRHTLDNIEPINKTKISCQV